MAEQQQNRPDVFTTTGDDQEAPAPYAEVRTPADEIGGLALFGYPRETRSSVLVYRDLQANFARSFGRAAFDAIPQIGPEGPRLDVRKRPTIRRHF